MSERDLETFGDLLRKIRGFGCPCAKCFAREFRGMSLADKRAAASVFREFAEALENAATEQARTAKQEGK